MFVGALSYLFTSWTKNNAERGFVWMNLKPDEFSRQIPTNKQNTTIYENWHHEWKWFHSIDYAIAFEINIV